MNDVDAIQRAQRLTSMGITVKSPSLVAAAKEINDFNARGGNRAMRRRAERAARSKR